MDIGPHGAGQPETQTSGAAALQAGTAPPAPAATASTNALPALPALPGSEATTAASSADAGTATQAAPSDATGAAGPPGHQVSAALLSLSRGADGAQSMTLRLEPAELGQVAIRIDRPQDAPARVDIAVERPETLTLLLRDQPDLQRALDQAGVPSDGRSLTVHLATPDSLTPSAGAHGGMTANAGSGQGGGNNGSGTRASGTGSTDDSGDTAQDDAPVPVPRWLRAGLDITA